MTSTEAFDRYLASCVRSQLRGEALHAWPADLDIADELAEQRFSYHGVALFLIEHGGELPKWPERLVNAVKEEARLQAVWEASHHMTIAPLIEALHEAGFEPLVMKGTALAYSAYGDAAVRRRGDTDLLVESPTRNAVRAVFERCGFRRCGDKRALQEPWAFATEMGFVHEVDLHWKVNASMAVSRAMEADHPRQRATPLPRLSTHAKAIGPVDSFIQVCINRAAHDEFGYMVEEEKLFEGDRLIWAVDLDRLAASFSPGDWSDLARIARLCGAGELVISGLAFARKTLGTEIPEAVFDTLKANDGKSGAISRYFSAHSARERFAADLDGAEGWDLRLPILSQHLFPGRQFMEERYPGSDRWPLAALHLRRLLDVGGRMLLGRSR